ncbi:hypothetical protein IQ241_04890 [Romeria aff. gracilis LEGE 07310]|uniref:Uncharacterized protein n=1 Tax=Vasconcelosia minhoensis LEGE 07310 TaxID=915328 RepID=A0A8J7AU28_9CYAN|nr:hypothetical protein [Romeria gracilis]MBE9076638.1 hypothetical protein [Romeria aff. gracilis LEGE 07310]
MKRIAISILSVLIATAAIAPVTRAAEESYSFQQRRLALLDQRGTKADDKLSLQEQRFQVLDRGSAKADDKTLQALRYDVLDRGSAKALGQ